MTKGIFAGICLGLATCIVAEAQPWQQGVEYRISVALDDEKHEISGDWELVYTNNSPERLSEIWLHLWPNAYKNNRTGYARQQNAQNEKEFLWSKPEQRGYITDLAFTGNGTPLTLEYDSKNPDIARLVLAQPLAPGASITLNSPFTVKLPESFSRLGHVDQQYQITQWYPKPAVYDDQGWHLMPYLDQGEFFSEFGSYEVQITLPKNYVVGATGQLQEQEEIDWLLNKAYEEYWEEGSMDFPPSAEETKTLTYVLDSIHDFAWFADKRYLVKHDSVEMPSGRKVGLWSMFNTQDRDVWESSIKYMKDGLVHYSRLVGEYPYDMATVVDGALSAGAGMEYPTITVLGGDDAFGLEQVIVHELGHNWFYGVLASNERAHPWMDEGMNSYYEMRYFMEKYPDMMAIRRRKEDSQGLKKILKRFGLWDFDFANFYQIGYQVTHSIGIDQPLNLAADEYSSINYGTTVYWKTAAALRMLEGYWGQAKYDRIMQAYWDAWRFKHPRPEDFQALIEQESGESMEWFFDGMIESRRGLDIALQSAKEEGNEWVVKVKQVAGEPGPVPVGLVKDGEVTAIQWVTLDRQNRSKEARFLSQGEDQVVIDPYEWYPETNLQNNRIRREGAFRKVEPYQFPPLFTAPRSDKTSIHFWTGTIGFNSYDGFMLGAGVYNNTLPDRRFTYAIFPYYAFASRDITGSYRIRWKPFKELVASNRVGIQLHGQRYSATQRHSATLTLDGMPLRRRNPIYNRTAVSYHNLILPETEDESLFMPLWGSDMALEISERVWQKTAKFSWSDEARGWYHSDLWRLENTLETTIAFSEKGNVMLRNYVGFQQSMTDSLSDLQYLYLDGGRDFLMQEVVFDRLGLTSGGTRYGRQTIGNEGDFKMNSPIRGAQWLVAFNAEVKIPGAYGLGVFADVAWTDGYDGVAYDAGVMWKVLPGIAELYFPLVGTNLSFQDIGQNIRFQLNLAAGNPYTLLEELAR